ncbi:MAG: hypothetical protein AB7J28_14460 [Hyphomonadaceae bacterium]
MSFAAFAPWLALAAAALFIAAALGAALMRPFFPIGAFVLIVFCAAALAALLLSAPPVALMLAVLGALASVALFGAALLSARPARAIRLTRALPGAIAAALAGAAILWAAPEIAPAPQLDAEALIQSVDVLAALIAFAGAVGAFALLGFGQRGLFALRRTEADD